MTVSRSKRFVFVDKKTNVSKKQVFIFGSIIVLVFGILVNKFVLKKKYPQKWI